ncbi:MAG: VOC family protein [Actinomycetota bacterium]
MQLQPIVYVTDIARSTRWWTTLLDREPTMTSDAWTSFDLGGGHLALHHSDNAGAGGGSVELSLVAEDLEAVAARVPPTRPIRDEPFGRSLQVTDPDGLVVQVNQH